MKKFDFNLTRKRATSDDVVFINFANTFPNPLYGLHCCPFWSHERTQIQVQPKKEDSRELRQGAQNILHTPTAWHKMSAGPLSI